MLATMTSQVWAPVSEYLTFLSQTQQIQAFCQLVRNYLRYRNYIRCHCSNRKVKSLCLVFVQFGENDWLVVV